MQVHIVPADDIIVKSNRQRRDLDQSKILELAGSIAENGLINPITVRWADDEYTLVAGQRRLKALEHLWFLGAKVVYNGREIEEGCVPCNFLGEIDPTDAEEIELEENVRRIDLSWQERADAITRLAALRIKRADLAGEPTPTVADIAREVKDLAAFPPGASLGAHHGDVREELIIGHALRDPEKAKIIESATSRKEAFKLLKRHEENQRHAALGQALGPSFTSALHTLQRGDSLLFMQEMPASTFDVVCSDPPYGIGADDFNDSGGKAAGGHFYSDSHETWTKLAEALARHSYRLAKSQAHAYIFCDIERFAELKRYFRDAAWTVFRTPLIWYNPGAIRAPWPEMGPQRKYQCILFAVKGGRPVTRLYGDVITSANDPNLGHPAQKPVAVLSDLLLRSVRPGDTVLDPFAGSGSIFPAAHQHKCRATGIEIDEAAYGIAANRLKELI
jgi:ParB/RepB/Spo0J family partition protein